MKSVAQYFSEYDGFHRTRGNEVCHFVGIPLILVSALGLFAGLAFSEGQFRWDVGILLWALASAWYIYLDWKLGGPFALVLLGSYFLGRAIPAPALWALFVVGWIFQGIGHSVYEKKSPAFFKNFEHLLIGPFWVFSKLVKY
jgi:uncharacterized membrane protein YGL010W